MEHYPTVAEIKSWTQEQKISYFETSLIATGRSGVDRVINFIRTSSDFYKAPASTLYHSNFEGGLLEHTLIVHSTALHYRDVMIEMDPSLAEKLDKSSVELVALLHDICKVCQYHPSWKYVKTSDGRGTQVPCYEFNDSFPIGHGEKSVIMLQFIGLQMSAEEMLAIRYHMGMWEATEGNLVKSLQSAMKITSLIQLLQIADFTGSSVLEETHKLV